MKKLFNELFFENSNNVQTSKSSQIFLETFGSWVDQRNPEEIVNKIYQSRTLDHLES